MDTPTSKHPARRIFDRLIAGLSRPDRELNRGLRLLRFQLRLGYLCLVQLRRNRFNHVAAALAFRTIFGLIPLLVMIGFFAQFFVNQDEAADAVQKFVLRQAGDATQIQWTTREGRVVDLQQVLARIIGGVYERMRVKGVGVAGLLVLIYAALALLDNIERAFNAIYQVASRRQLWRRVTSYWTVLTLLPLCFGTVMFTGGRVLDLLAGPAGERGPFGATVAVAYGLLITWLFLTAVYLVLPNTRVSWRAAMFGALTAAVPWQVLQFAFGMYVHHASTMSLYGSMGGLLLFFLYIYVTWLVILFGLQVSFVVQHLRGLELEERLLGQGGFALLDRVWLFRLAGRLARAFRDGEGPMAVDALALEFGLPTRAAGRIADELAERGLLARVQGDGRAVRYQLNRPAETIRLADLAAAADALDAGTPPAAEQAAGSAERYLAEMKRQDLARLEGRRLSDLLAGPPGDAKSDSAPATG